MGFVVTAWNVRHIRRVYSSCVVRRALAFLCTAHRHSTRLPLIQQSDTTHQCRLISAGPYDINLAKYYPPFKIPASYFLSANRGDDDYKHYRGHGHRGWWDFVSSAFHVVLFVSIPYIISQCVDSRDFPKLFPCAQCETKAEEEETQEVKTDLLSRNEEDVLQSLQRKIGSKRNEEGKISLRTAVKKAQELCLMKKDEMSCPGLVVCVSVDGKQVYAEGFGYADLENRLPMMPHSVMRIASISKSITATITAKLWEKGQLDLDKPVQHYVPAYPEKEFMGEKVVLTVRQLLNHTSGIRHYKYDQDVVSQFDEPIRVLATGIQTASSNLFYSVGPNSKRQTEAEKDEKKKKEDKNREEKKKMRKEVSEMEREEYYSVKPYATSEEALSMFSKDQLISKPGKRFFYTTFGYTVLGAVVEAVTKQPFTNVVARTLQHLGLKETYLDLHGPIIYNRARYYMKNEEGRIVNVPYVDSSYKYAGGGMLSTAEDMVKFGNILLYSAQHKDDDPGLPGYLKASTVAHFWAPTAKKGALHFYGLGFEVTPEKEHYGMCEHHSFGAGHTGAAVGVSSALFILPRGPDTSTLESNQKPTPSSASTSSSAVLSSATSPPKGVVVVVIVNMISVSVKDVTQKIARTFEKVDFSL